MVLFLKEFRRNWMECIDRMSSDMEKKFGKTCEMMEVFCFVISVIDLSRHKG
jgi:hypothetical protein